MKVTVSLLWSSKVIYIHNKITFFILSTIYWKDETDNNWKSPKYLHGSESYSKTHIYNLNTNYKKNVYVGNM
jgi:hypothetical protein